MKNNSLALPVLMVICAFFVWFLALNHSAAKTHIPPPKIASEEVSSNASAVLASDLDFDDMFVPAISDATSFFNDVSSASQQVGVTCGAYPRCPDCNGRGNVCLGAKEFYGGIIGLIGGKKAIIRKCQQANALDYCGGSRACVRLTRAAQNRHRASYGGGCYSQCAKVAVCYLDNR